MKQVLRRILVFALGLCVFTSCAAPVVPSEEKDDRTVIPVATWLDRETSHTKKIVNLFNAAQDEIRIEIVTYDPGETTTIAASLERAYMSFLSGDTPDLYHTQSFDASKLRNAGLIEDWYPVMAADPSFDMGDYQTHIWKLLETDGKLYQLSASFDLFGLGGTKELFGDRTGWTLAEFEQFLQEHADTIGTTQARMLQLMLWYGSQFDFIDSKSKTCNFESEEFIDWLSFLSRLPKAESAVKQLTVARVGNIVRFASDSFSRNDFIPGADSWSDPQFWNYMRYTGLPNMNGDGPAVTIDDTYALSSTTKHKDACWTFMKWLLSYETQELLFAYTDHDSMQQQKEFGFNAWSMAIPIRADLWEEILARAQLDSSHEESMFYGRGSHNILEDGTRVLVDPYPGLPEEEINYLRNIVANADRASLGFFDYQSITAIVEEEVLAYLAGDKTAEECAHLIQSRVSILLAEMQ